MVVSLLQSLTLKLAVLQMDLAPIATLTQVAQLIIPILCTLTNGLLIGAQFPIESANILMSNLRSNASNCVTMLITSTVAIVHSTSQDSMIVSCSKSAPI